MKYRKLRIAWSVAWGVVAALLCVLWVRGFHPTRSDGASIRFALPNSNRLSIVSAGNHLYIGESAIVSRPNGNKGRPVYRQKWGFTFPNLLVLVALLGIAASSWLPFRFSLRTPLIATTLVAMGLGLIAWLG